MWAAGKDRTGLIVALVMTVCGVDRTEVVENYHLSERFLAPIAYEIREENGKKGTSLTWSRLQFAPPHACIDSPHTHTHYRTHDTRTTAHAQPHTRTHKGWVSRSTGRRGR